MLKKILLIGYCVLIISILNSCDKDNKIKPIINSKKLETDQDFIKFAKEADTVYISVLFIQNPSFHESKKIKLPKVEKKADLYNIMSQYWLSDFVEALWKEGSKFMPEKKFGFYSEGSPSLLSAEEIFVSNKTDNMITVTGKVPIIWTDDYGYRDLIIKKTNEGWKVIDGKFRNKE